MATTLAVGLTASGYLLAAAMFSNSGLSVPSGVGRVWMIVGGGGALVVFNGVPGGGHAPLCEPLEPLESVVDEDPVLVGLSCITGLSCS